MGDLPPDFFAKTYTDPDLGMSMMPTALPVHAFNGFLAVLGVPS